MNIVLHCYKIFSNNSIFFHLMKVLITELHVKAACNSRAGIYLDPTAGMSQDYSMGFGLMANTFCYYLLNIEHVPLISRTFQKSNRKTEPNLPKCFCAGTPRAVLKSSPQLPLRSLVPAPEHVGLLLGSMGMLGPQAKCDSAQGKSLPLGFCPILARGGSHQGFSF